MYIIAEYLFLENFIINYLILKITKKVTRTKASRKRILFTGLLASLYSFTFFFRPTIFLTSFYMKIIISIIIVKLAYNPKNMELFIKQISSFYLVSFVFGGSTLGMYYFSTNYVDTIFNEIDYAVGFPIKHLILGVSFGMIMITNVLNYYYEKLSREKLISEIEISLNGKSIRLQALLDTGNSLVDPLSNLPVLVVQFNQVKDLLPERMNKIFKEDQENDFRLLERVMEEIEGSMSIRLIPFNSVGNSNGILIGFIPDFIIIHNGNDEVIYEDLVIGIFKGKLSSDGQYTGLLNGEILNRGNLSVNEN